MEGREVEYLLSRSKTARKLRVKVGLDSLQVILPASREVGEAEEFLRQNESWVLSQLDRMGRYRTARREEKTTGEMLFRGEPTQVVVTRSESWRGPNRVQFSEGCILVLCGSASLTYPASSLENWLRKQAKQTIVRLVDVK